MWRRGVLWNCSHSMARPTDHGPHGFGRFDRSGSSTTEHRIGMAQISAKMEAAMMHHDYMPFDINFEVQR
jgi:hypothetical protein